MSRSYINNILLLDTSYLFQVGLILNNSVDVFKTTQEKSSDAIVPLIISRLLELKVDFKDIAAVAVISGPGLFTGVRTAVVLSNMMASLLNTSLIDITVFEAISYEAFQSNSDIDFSLCLVNVGKKGAVACLLDKEMNTVLDPLYLAEDCIFEYLQNSLFSKYLTSTIAIAGNKQDLLFEKGICDLYSNVVFLESITNPSLSIMAEISQLKLANHNISNKIEPLYIKDADAKKLSEKS